MRDPNATYDPTLNEPTVNQKQVAQTLFDFVQEVRKQMSDQDPDSPGQLTPMEILQIALSKVPAAAPVLVNLIRDDVSNVEDGEFVGHILFRQLYY